MASSLDKFNTGFNELLLNSVLVPIAAYLEEQKIEVELADLKELFSLPTKSSGCVHKPQRGKNPQPCGKETLPGEEFCKTHAKKKKEESKPPLLARMPKSLNPPTATPLVRKPLNALDLKNLPPLRLSAKSEE